MAINLMKGQKVDLTKGNPGLRNLLVGLGWDTNKYTGGSDFDLDASVFMLGANGKVRSNLDFIYYGNLKHNSGSVEHMGDNLTGGGDGDDEQIKVNLASVPSDVEKNSCPCNSDLSYIEGSFIFQKVFRHFFVARCDSSMLFGRHCGIHHGCWSKHGA